MIDERDATRKWRTLFHGSSVTPQTMVDAAALLEEMSPESPLRLRLSNELEELKSRSEGRPARRRR